MATIIGPINDISPGLPGGSSVAYNVTGTGVIKSVPGIICSVSCSTGGTLTLNDANALVTAQTITAITKDANAVVTVSTVSGSNPFAVGNSIAFSGVGGMTQINAATGLVTAIGGASGAWTVTTNINSTSFTTFTSGGNAASFAVTNQAWVSPTMTAGQTFTLNWPCAAGIIVSALASAVVAITFS